MEDQKGKTPKPEGKFLKQPKIRRGIIGWLLIVLLLAWDGLLLNMILKELIEPVYGAAFVGVVSIYLGYQL